MLCSHRWYLALLLCPWFSSIAAPITLAQVVPDATLGTEQSQIAPGVVRGGTAELIQGGAVRGNNLFHSFLEFNVNAGQRVYFANPVGIESILSRVTGNTPSSIAGTLGVDGAADLFLINPKGLVFGESSSLDIQGAFHASTASAIPLGDGIYSATAPEQSTLLTVKPRALFSSYLSDTAGDIQNKGQLRPQGNLTFAANTIDFQGPVIADGGNISFFARRDIAFNSSGAYAWSLGGNIALESGGSISLLDGAQVDTAPFDGNSGDLNVNAQHLTMTNGAQLKTGSFFSGLGGNLTVNVTGTISLSGIGFDPSGNLGSTGLIASSLVPSSTGTSGNIRVTAPVLKLLNGGSIGTQTLNEQPAGAITINAPSTIQVSGVANSPSGEFRSAISASSGSNAAAGQINLTAPQLVIDGGGSIGASGVGTFGPGGTIDITARQILVDGVSPDGEPSNIVSRSLFLGNAGNILIRDAQVIQLTNGAQIDISASGPGASSGNLTLNTEDLALANNSKILANSIFGNAGQVNIIVTGNFTLTTNSSVTGDNFTSGSGAQFSVQANRLRVEDGSFISTSTFGAGDAGNLDIQATEAVEILNNGFVSTGTFTGRGDGGNLTISVPLLLIDKGLVESNSFSSGAAGNIILNVANLLIRNRGEVAVRGIFESANTGDITINAGIIQLEDEGKISASSSSQNGGNISLTADKRLVLRRNALIDANAGDSRDLITPPPGTGNGGNVRISAPFVVGIPGENSDIVATASLGNGGRVDIEARGLFGIESRSQRTFLSDITASSDVGLSGTVAVNTPDNSFIENNLASLPDNTIDTAALTARSCIARSNQNQGSFVVVGRGGLPQRPSEGNIVTFPTGAVRARGHKQSQSRVPSINSAFLEPDGMYRLSDGRLVLGRMCPG
ncbi:filamentous hemagglutinin N-terminal domain-containing protein [filamentous cyanobacterium LEGE 11480]|uniref:Filamentous hemagglutinin N-terminal domain-containing protein n=1 Tax=Romeriopsis navalis LEGE 11480 TaxID=2777977 RepID=A0A928Z4N7_9CYAN|nr:filamentous hemagglutinin N-terminal domain-containing protein [Romeriopsis navalis]MBE9031217.1 filamentous hemagglutinin N-terminal domain-containing protein [Romeriopsis navalis LEGE 11480]